MHQSVLGIAIAAVAVACGITWSTAGKRRSGTTRRLLLVACAAWAVLPFVSRGDAATVVAVFAAVLGVAAAMAALAEHASSADVAVVAATGLLVAGIAPRSSVRGEAVVAAMFVAATALVVGFGLARQSAAGEASGRTTVSLFVGVATAIAGSAGTAGLAQWGLDRQTSGAVMIAGLALVAVDGVWRPARPDTFLVRVVVVASAALVGIAGFGAAHPPAFMLIAALVLVVAVGERGVVRRAPRQVESAEMREALATITRQEELFRSLVADSTDLVTLIDASGNVEYQNAAAGALLERDVAEVIGRPVEYLVHPDDRAVLLGLLDPTRLHDCHAVSLDLRFARSDGSWCRTETTVTNHLGNPAVRALALTSRDIGDRKDLEEQLVTRAFHDSLTGLGNRALFRDRLEHAVARARRYSVGLAVLFIDLDGFKLVNDTLGHDVGDSLLVEVGTRLSKQLRASDTVARMGGDEFAILLETPNDVSQAVTVAGRLLATLQTPIFVESFPLRVTCSIGVVTTGGKQAASAEDLLRNADLAMYRAKNLGKNQVARYEESMRDAALNRVRLEKELRHAIDRDELVLHYQPIGSIASGEITGVEALVRWNHPDRGMIPPSEFVAVAEESSLIVELGRWALAKACSDMSLISLATGRTDFWVSVNVATRQLLQPGLVQSVRGALNRSGMDPSRLVLEITEGALLDDPKACSSLLHQLRSLGVRLAIDDFGTGYSSLSRLRSFAVDKLKIDRSFIQEIVNANDRAPIVAAVMAMAHSLGLTAVAEGVETVEQLVCLHRHGCEEVQGYLLSRPLPMEDLEAMMRKTGDLLRAAGAPIRGAFAESSLSSLVREAAGSRRPEILRLLMSELTRQLGAAESFLARPDASYRGEVVVLSSGAGSIHIPDGFIVETPEPGTFRAIVGGEVPESLRERGVESLTVVPVGSDPSAPPLVLAVACSAATRLPSQHVVLMELLTRLLGDTEDGVAAAETVLANA